MGFEDRFKNYLEKYDTGVKILSTVAIIATSVLALAGAHAYYKNFIWRPKVYVLSVDFDAGIATLTVNGKNRILYGNATIYAGAEWGVRFGTINNNENITTYDTLEIVRKGLVMDTLKIRQEYQ